MLTALAIIYGVSLIGFALAVITAPEGYQIEGRGFFYGRMGR